MDVVERGKNARYVNVGGSVVYRRISVVPDEQVIPAEPRADRQHDADRNQHANRESRGDDLEQAGELMGSGLPWLRAGGGKRRTDRRHKGKQQAAEAGRPSRPEGGQGEHVEADIATEDGVGLAEILSFEEKEVVSELLGEDVSCDDAHQHTGSEKEAPTGGTDGVRVCRRGDRECEHNECHSKECCSRPKVGPEDAFESHASEEPKVREQDCEPIQQIKPGQDAGHGQRSAPKGDRRVDNW